MDRARFYAALRRRDSGVFSTSLSQAQVAGMEAILDAGEAERLPLPHMANVLAQVKRETGGYMLPIKETVLPHHKDKNPSDATVIRRLDRAFAKGLLPWVKRPYWRDGAFGRGPIQITHWHNYERVGKVLGVDLRGDPSKALDPQIGARIAVVGMKLGLFTGKKLADYLFPEAISLPPSLNPRRIVNGKDGSDAEVAAAHRAFASALQEAGWAPKPAQKPAGPPLVLRPPTPAPAPAAPPAAKRPGAVSGGIAALVVAAGAALAAKWAEFTQWAAGWWPF